jgi:hypothetical protein
MAIDSCAQSDKDFCGTFWLDVDANNVVPSGCGAIVVVVVVVVVVGEDEEE